MLGTSQVKVLCENDRTNGIKKIGILGVIFVNSGGDISHTSSPIVD